jgi:glycosyltransferase involved in cell wall biosynthesis
VAFKKTLLIISHTEHFISDGQYVGWGPTITEINFLANYWDEIIHVACLYDLEAPASSLNYTSSNIRFVPITPFGGKTIFKKISILFLMPNILSIIRNELKNATEVQLRLPTGIGVFLLPWFTLQKRNYTFWVKYAGNWIQKNPPISYKFQRYWLKKNLAKAKVTINGYWPKQDTHCISFENPCLYQEEVINASIQVLHKQFYPPFTLIFVGRLEDPKGVSRILDALEFITLNKVKEVHFIGDGPNILMYKRKASNLEIPIFFHGFLPRNKVHEILKLSHFILLPSNSEGFPKVLAEAACYGVVPVVSDVSSIPHYINSTNGFLWNSKFDFSIFLQNVLDTSFTDLQQKKINIYQISLQFSYESYLEKLKKSIL